MKTCGLLLIGLVALAPRAAHAQTIRGVVVEDSTRMPVAGATVSVLRTGGGQVPSVRTDSVGAFHLALDSSGVVVLRVTHPFYRTVDADTVSVGEDEVVTLELRLARHAIPLEPLVVTARVDRRLGAFHERARTSAFGRFLTRADIERRPGVRPAELLRGVPGVRLVFVPPCAGCASEEVIYLRGGAGQCAPTVLIDGMVVKQDAGFPIDALLTTDDLDGVEIYVEPGSVPPALGVFSSSCGVVAFWTRSPEGGKLTWKRVGVALAIAVILYVLLR